MLSSDSRNFKTTLIRAKLRQRAATAFSTGAILCLKANNSLQDTIRVTMIRTLSKRTGARERSTSPSRRNTCARSASIVVWTKYSRRVRRHATEIRRRRRLQIAQCHKRQERWPSQIGRRKSTQSSIRKEPRTVSRRSPLTSKRRRESRGSRLAPW